jgi:lipopolysaccharide export system ATP-binding protein
MGFDVFTFNRPPRTIITNATLREAAPSACESSSADQVSEGLSLVAVKKRFGRTVALNGLTLRVGRGETVGLFGRDGSGKTVCFEAIMGLIGIESGQILLDGHDITKLTVDQRGPLGLSYLPQETSIFRDMSTAANLRAVLEHTEKDPAAREGRLEALLRTFAIDYVRDTPASRLSGGERRRCEVARAMASSPAFMLLDEPFAGIDPMSVNSIKASIATLKARNVGVLLSDQNVREALTVIDRAYVIHEGRIIFKGSGAEMLSNPIVRRSYLGSDFE